MIANQRQIVKGDAPYWVAISFVENFGPQKFKRLAMFFPDMKTAWEASEKELLWAGLAEKDVDAIKQQRATLDPHATWAHLGTLGIRAITLQDPEYPDLLKQIYGPPPVLYAKGRSLKRIQPIIAVVGTRNMTSYGRMATESIVHDLARAGVVIVSGLALGIDAEAHAACLQAKGVTIAVLGSGLAQIYPRENERLAKRIEQQGTLVSEYPPHVRPQKYHFPVRNRIIAGLALGTIVIEGDEDSGSLITARRALDENRDVFAVPGNIFHASSRGPNALIQMGAKPVVSARDVLEALDIKQVEQMVAVQESFGDTTEEKIVLELLTGEPLHIDELIKRSKLETSVVHSTLTLLEMKGLAKNTGAMQYVRARK